MLKLFRFLHKSLWALLLAVLCIGVQVFFELQIPACMSDLVNVGIQSRGIEHAAPECLTSSDAAVLLPFMTNSEQRLFGQCYAAGGNGVLRRASLEPETLRRLDRAFTTAEWTLLRLLADLPAGGDIGRAADSQTTADLSDINLVAIRAAAAQLADAPGSAYAAARRQALAVPATLAAQTGAAFAAAFEASAGADTASAQYSYLLKVGGRMALCAVLAAAASLLAALAAARTGAGLARNLRRAVFIKVQSFRRADFDHFTNATLLARTTNDISLVQSAVIALIRVAFFAFCMGAGGVLMAAASSPVLAWILTAAVGASSAVVWIIFRITRPRYRIVQDMIDSLNLIAREDVEGAATIRAYSGEQHEEERFDRANDKLATTQLGINRVLIFLSPAFGLAVNGASLAVMWFGAAAVQKSALEVGNIVADIQYAGIVLAAFALIAGMFVTVPRTAISLERIEDVLSWDPQDADLPPGPGGPAPGLEAQHLTLTWPGAERPVLADVSFRTTTGQVAAVIGQTGSGKSTLLDTLAGARDPDSGRVLLGGQDLHALPHAVADELVAYLPQDRSLLASVVAAHSLAAARVLPADASSWQIKNLDAESLRRRLLAGSASLYLLDEPFMDLTDTGREALWNDIRQASSRGAVILAASRVRDVRRADYILVLENGRITAVGTHDELVRTHGLYRDLARADGEAPDA